MGGKNMKKALVAVLCMMMIVASLAGCTNSPGATTAPTSAPSSATEISTTTPAPTTEVLAPVTFTLFDCLNRSLDVNYTETPIVKKIIEKTGITIDWQYTTGGDYIPKIALMCASNEYPDLIYAQDASPLLYEAGAIIKLDDLVKQHGPDIQKFFGTDILKACAWNLNDRSIYFIPRGLDDGTTTVEVKEGYLLQFAALKEDGYPKIVTLTDYEKVIKNYLQKHPKTDEGLPTLGLSLCFDGWNAVFSAKNPPAIAAGFSFYNDDGDWFIDLNTHQATLRYRTPEYKESYKWLNHMNATGLIDPESFVQKFDQYTAKIAKGQVVGILDNISWHVSSAIDALKADGKYDKMYAVLGPTINESIKFGAHNKGRIAPTYGLMITTTCKDPIRAMEYINWLCTDEAQILNNWGIEGVNYKLVDGKRVIPADEWKTRMADNAAYTKKTGIGIMLDPFPVAVIAQKDATGQTYIPDDMQTQLDLQMQPEKDALKAYGVQFWKQLFPDPNTIPVSPWGPAWVINFATDSNDATIQTKCKEIVSKNLVKAILATPQDFDTVWAQFMSELDAAGVQQMEKDFSVLVDRKIKLLSGN